MSEVVIRSKFLDDFAALERLLVTYQGCIREEEREDILLDLSGKILAAKEKVLRAEEAGREFLEQVRSLIITARIGVDGTDEAVEHSLFQADKMIYDRLIPQQKGGEG
jgi:hypothetical protein